MASVKRRHRSQRPKESQKKPRVFGWKHVALVIFCLLVVAGPLAFGAVDRITQVVLLALFAVGLYARPAVITPLSPWANRLLIALLAVVLFKEFAPAALFGHTHWRTVLEGSFGLTLPWTHHPEPGRAVDALLTCAGAALWFIWVRTLASDREARPVLAWAMVAAGAVVTAVAYATRGMDPQAIYGLRFTPGWTGFGPFPNRNHTGDFLAMSLVLGCGCTGWAVACKNRSAAMAGGTLSVITFLGLLGTQSRGGLLAAGLGVACFAVLLFAKLRSRTVLAVFIAGAVVAGALMVMFGGGLFERFSSKEGGQVSNLMRLQIWQDALRVWSDAPLFGHGLKTFPQIIGLYQTLRLEDQVILHPESSWLQFLTELGLVPVLLGLAGMTMFLSKSVRAAFGRQRTFFLRAGALGAFAVLVFHSAIDVPAHRWGTLGFALAALAIGCPFASPDHLPSGSRRAALVPLAIAVFWSLPFLFDWPRWSPFTVSRLVTREYYAGGVPIEDMEAASSCFPLEAELHQEIGVRQVRILGRARPTVWQRHFGIASTLVPGSWPLVAAQARTVANVAPGLSIGYWQQAIERCDMHREDVLATAVRETAMFPMAPLLWGRYVEASPDLLLPYARALQDDGARYYFSIWWQTRALTAALTKTELEVFYQNGARWGTRAQFDDWMQARAAWKDRDYRLWAALLHEWHDEKSAFELLAKHMPEPEFPRNASSASREMLEVKWRNAPKDVVNAQALAQARRMNGETAGSDEIILAVAEKDYAPPWFTLKGGYILGRQERFPDAVGMMLRAAQGQGSKKK